MLPQQPGKLKNPNGGIYGQMTDQSHPWSMLRHEQLNLDILKDDIDRPVKPPTNDKASYARWLNEMRRLPVDIEKVMEYFTPVAPNQEWNPVLEPNGIALITTGQAKTYMNSYASHTLSELVEDYLDMLANRRWDDNAGGYAPTSRNQGKPFVNDVKDMEVYTQKRVAHLKKDVSAKAKKRRPLMGFPD
jgi:hypothetical protein